MMTVKRSNGGGWGRDAQDFRSVVRGGPLAEAGSMKRRRQPHEDVEERRSRGTATGKGLGRESAPCAGRV